MPEFTNKEIKEVLLPTLEVLARLRLPYKGALQMRVITLELRGHMAMVEDLREVSLKSFAKLDDNGEIRTRKDKNDRPTNVVIFKDEDEEKLAPTNDTTQAAQDFATFSRELFGNTYECKETLTLDHLQDEACPWNSPAELLINLGNLLVIPEQGDSE